MRIVVCIKQVPDTNEVKLDPITGTLLREGVPSIINPDDLAGIEAALAIKDEKDSKVSITVVSMGPAQADVALREALAMGCDEAYLISDRAFAGADTWATSSTLAGAVKKLGYDLIITGRQAIDGDTAQVGPQVAEKLDIPQVTYVNHLECKNDSVVVHRELEDGYHLIEVKLPCVLTAIGGLGEPRYPRFPGIYAAYQKDIPRWNMQDVGLLGSKEIGLEGSPTKVHRSFTPKVERAGEVFPVANRDTVAQLVSRLRERHLV